MASNLLKTLIRSQILPSSRRKFSVSSKQPNRLSNRRSCEQSYSQMDAGFKGL